MQIKSLKNTRVKNLVIFLLFLAATVIIVSLFPSEGKFRYEFYRGKPWKNEVLVAPFDFPIYKNESVLAMEKDSALRSFIPFYKLDTLIQKQIIESFTQLFENTWQVYFDKLGAEPDMPFRKYRMNKIKEAYYEEIISLLKDLYYRGIVSDAPQFESINNSSKAINIISEQIVEERQKTSVYTQTTAYQFIRHQLSEIAAQIQKEVSEEKRFSESLDITNLIRPNLFYDTETSQKVQNQIIEDISETQGMVQAGEKIIALGELINDEKFQILLSLKREYETNPGVARNYNIILAGQVLIVSFTFLVLYLFLFHFRKEVLYSINKTAFILLVVIIMAFFSNVTIKAQSISLYVMPMLILPIIMRTFFDARIALFVHIITILLISFWAPNSFEFIFMNFIAGVVAIFTLRNVYRRGILFVTAVITFFTYSLLYSGINILQDGNLNNLDVISFAWFGGNALLMLTTYPLIFIFERTFGFISDATLLELSDTNQPLLRELAEKAPGTFHHSLQVANLAEEAALKTGGNALLIRCGSLYHDIGKMDDPMYYIENLNSTFNPHEELEFRVSAEKIIGHVIKGEQIARKHKLPGIITDFILTHHGTTTVQYFYKSYLKEYPDGEMDKSRFSYPGPIPFSRETAIVMMADAIEAASRSMKNVNKDNINELVENIFKYQFDENQFINSNLTLRNIERIKEVFKNKLQNIYHTRIEYPK